MKKITLLVACVMASGMAHAVKFETSGLLKMTDTNCDLLLNENVSLQLSASVKAGASCSTTGIAMAACHTAGRTTSREVEVLIADPNDATKLISQTPKVYKTQTGPAVATGSTFQGTVVPTYPAATACDATVAETAAADRLK